MMTFSEFIYSKFKSFSHGHDMTHEEIDGLWYRKEDYEKALERYDDYKFNNHLKGLKDERVLFVLFKAGSIHAYHDVSEYKYKSLLNAESVGSYFNKSIKPEHPETKEL